MTECHIDIENKLLYKQNLSSTLSHSLVHILIYLLWIGDFMNINNSNRNTEFQMYIHDAWFEALIKWAHWYNIKYGAERTDRAKWKRREDDEME